MRPIIARIICFLTVLLLSANSVFSAVTYFEKNNQFHDSDNLILKFYNADEEEEEKNSPSFLAENDDIEDFELLSDAEDSFTFELSFINIDQKSECSYSSKNTIGLHVPLWLWVRHILI